MGRTLFWYLFKDLVRVFLLSAIVLAGIMSFGGLLKPLTRNGLDVIQVVQMWLYLMPAMMTYSMPVAAVFATSIIYGRLAADNELTACRSSGISYGSICFPAISLGIVSALCSLVFLSYVVPFFSFQVERVLYDNVAKVIASEIQGSHASGGKGKPTIFAQDAYIPPESGQNNEQIIVLRQPVIMTSKPHPERPELKVPDIFSMAKKATLYIRKSETGEVEISGVLEHATRFPRALGSGAEYGLGRIEFGPLSYPSPLRQNVKFMDITSLKALAATPERTNRVKRAMQGYILAEQRQILYKQLTERVMHSPERGFTINAGEQYQILAPGATPRDDGEGNLLITPPPGQRVRLVIHHDDQRTVGTFDAAEMRVRVDLNNDYQLVIYNFIMLDVLMLHGEDIISKPSETRLCTASMPPELRQIQKRTAAYYLSPDSPLKGETLDLQRNRLVSLNEVIAEMHSRASFALSCLVLVMVGAVLGMQFRSGDFLSAFAVSVIPALVTITLVVAGNQTAGQVHPKTLANPIVTAIGLIWLGNILAAILALALFLRIRRT